MIRKTNKIKLVFIATIFIGILFSACQKQNNNKETELLKKENELLQKENELLKKEKELENQDIKPELIKSEKETQKKLEKINWIGTWSYNDGSVEYTLKIDETYKGMNICTYDAIGIQTWYELECRGYDKSDVFELYFWGVNDGGFFYEDRINSNKPILTLKYMDGKIVTFWDQLFNNFVEEGNRSGEVCFIKN
jgi:hypothetical protein